MTSRFQQVRDFLTEQGRPCTPGEIAEGIGAKRSHAFAVVLGSMTRDGWLKRELDGTRKLYSLTDKSPRRKKTAAQLKARRRAWETSRNRAAGIRPREEWLEERRRKAAERREQHARDVAQRREERAASRSARKAAKAAVKKPLHDSKPKPHVVVKLAPLPVAKKDEPRETVEQWMARTGKRPQVLPLGAVSRPISLGDYNGRTRKAA